MKKQDEIRAFGGMVPAAALAALLAAALSAGPLAGRNAAFAAGPGDALAQTAAETAAADQAQAASEAAAADQAQAATEAEAAAADQAQAVTETEAAPSEPVVQGGVLRYEALQEAVHNGNPDVLASIKNYEDRLSQYEQALNELIFERRDAYSERERAADNRDKDLAKSWKTEYDTYTTSITMYRKMRDSMTSHSGQRSLRQAERQATIAAQSLMISYESLRHQRDTAQKEADLRRRQWELSKTRRTAGLASDVDVLSAENSFLAAASRLSSTEDSLAAAYRNLCYMVGMPDDGSLTIAPLPSPDPARIAGMNLEEDTRKAIGNNTTLISQRKQNRGSSTPVTDVRLRTNAEGEQKLTSKMASLYEAVLQKQQEYNSAQIGWAKAQEAKRISDLKASAGLLGEPEQLSAELDYVSAEASFSAASLAFLQAMDTYDWAVIGMTGLE